MTNKELMKQMSDETKKETSINGVIEAAKSAMCDTRCKFPDQYNVKDDDIAFEEMIREQCNYCPLNIF